MKYIKTYENIFNKPSYKVGDIVEINIKNFKIQGLPEIGEITKIQNRGVTQKIYSISFLNDKLHLFVKGSDIVRTLTPEEIEQYKLEQDTDKYNL